VVEYGYLDDNPDQIQPASANSITPRDLYNLTSVPQVALNGTNQRVNAASVVEGGSTINGMLLTREGADDYNDWAKLNNDSEWSFDALLPYFKKVFYAHDIYQGILVTNETTRV
jgi:choline dehydrogenase-like flavoprotein